MIYTIRKILVRLLPLLALTSRLIFSAIKKGDSITVAYLLNKGVDPNIRTSQGNTALMIASLVGFTNIVVALLEYGTDLNLKADNGENALMLASQAGHTEICLLYTSPSPRDGLLSRMPSSA